MPTLFEEVEGPADKGLMRVMQRQDAQQVRASVPAVPIAIGGWLVTVLLGMALLVGVGATLVGVLIVLNQAHGSTSSAVQLGSTGSSISALTWLAAIGVAVGGWVVGIALSWAAYVLECLSEMELRGRLMPEGSRAVRAD